jgi:hypothetical protein
VRAYDKRLPKPRHEDVLRKKLGMLHVMYGGGKLQNLKLKIKN